MEPLCTDELRELVDRHSAALELFARQWTESHAADVVQAAFVKLATHPPPREQIVCWLYRVVRNEAVSAARSAARRKRHENGRAELAKDWFVPNSDDRLDAVEAARALAELPQEYREVIVARLWGGLSFQDIAELLEISSSSAHRNYIAGLKALRERLGMTWIRNNP